VADGLLSSVGSEMLDQSSANHACRCGKRTFHPE